MTMKIKTPRLILRQWQDSDLESFAKLNADSEVMRYFPNPLTEDESNAIADKIRQFITENGYGFWAVELICTSEFIGFVGLHDIDIASGIPDACRLNHEFVEIGWRLAKRYWGNGYATESAKAVLNFAFHELQLGNVYSFTALVNSPSQKVMQRIGMVNTGRDFNHPKLKRGHELERHCLYSING